MDTRWRRAAGPMRPGLTLPELLAAVAALGAVGTLLLARPSPVPPTLPPLAAAGEVDPPPVDLPATPGNLLVNGSFEASPTSFGCRSMPGWRISAGTVDVLSPGYWEPAPGQGSHSLDLVGSPGAATIEQTFATEPGREYRFSGWVAHNPEKLGMTDARAEVFVDGERLVQLVHRDAGATNRAMHWQPFATGFRATGAQTTLAITDVSGHGDLWGTALDGLAVTPDSDR